PDFGAIGTGVSDCPHDDRLAIMNFGLARKAPERDGCHKCSYPQFGQASSDDCSHKLYAVRLPPTAQGAVHDRSQQIARMLAALRLSQHTGGYDVIIKFPYNACRRIIARRPRRSKNGRPEERAAKGTPKLAGPSRKRWSKNGTPQQRAAKLAAKLKRSATII